MNWNDVKNTVSNAADHTWNTIKSAADTKVGKVVIGTAVGAVTGILAAKVSGYKGIGMVGKDDKNRNKGVGTSTETAGAVTGALAGAFLANQVTEPIKENN